MIRQTILNQIMDHAEELVALLLRNGNISKELAAGLRERITQVPQSIPANVFAERLIERGVIDRGIADAALQQIASEKEKLLQSDPALKSPKKSSALPRPPVSLPEASSLEPLPPPVSSGIASKIKVKKKSKNPWEGKLFLFGGSILILLLVLAVFLYAAIYRRSAGEFLNSINAAYDSGQYSEAVKGYDKFVESFPNHSAVTQARIRGSLSKMRLALESKSDWSKALAVAKEEIGKIVQNQDYRQEAQPELTAMLPSIAEGLGEEAKKNKDTALIASTEEALELVQKYVPLSTQPQDRLQKVQMNIDFAKREIAKDGRLISAMSEIQTLVPEGKIREAYDLVAEVLRDYPVLADDPRYIDLLRTISLGEKQAARWVAEPLSPNTAADVSEERSAQPVLLLANRIGGEEPAGRSTQTLFVYAEGAVFAVRSTDGTILWKKNIDGSSFSGNLAPTVLPLEGTQDALLIDHRNWELLRIDAGSGNIRFRVSIGEPFRLTTAATHMPMLTTESGRLFVIDLNTGQTKGHIQFPQPCDVAPTSDMQNGQVLQIARHSTLYICKEETPGKGPTVESVYLGHHSGTVRVSPFFFGTYFLVVAQSDPLNSTIQVYRFQNFGSIQNSEPTEGAEKPASPLQLVQEIPVKGIVDTPPVVDRDRMFLASDLGGVYLFALDPSSDPKAPIKLAGESSRKDMEGKLADADKPEEKGTIRFLGLFDQTLWVAGSELISFDIQQSRSRLVPRTVLDPLTKTLAPLRRVDNAIFRVFQYRGQNNVSIKGISIADGKTYWETQLADAVVAEPTFDPASQSFRAVTQSGKMYQTVVSSTQSSMQILDKPTAELGSEKRGQPVRLIVPLKNNFEAWIERTNASKSIPVYDPDPNNSRHFRFIPIDVDIQSDPIPLGPGLLTPLTNGLVQFFDPKSGFPLAVEPFAGTIVPGQKTEWSSPVQIDQLSENSLFDFLILDRGQSVLYRVGSIKDNKKVNFRTVGSLPNLIPRTETVCCLGENIFVFSKTDGVIQEVSLSNFSPGRTHDLGSRIVWGPEPIGTPISQIVFATEDKKLHLLSKESETVIRATDLPSAPILGKPLFDDSELILLSADGAIEKFNRTNGELIESRESGIRPQTGAVFLGNNLLLTGRDGCLYVIPK